MSYRHVCSRLSGLVFALLLLFMASTAYAAERHWIGSNNALSTEWINTANWSASAGGASASAVPTANDDVYFNVGGGNVFLQGVARVRSVHLQSTWSGSVRVGTGWLIALTDGINVQSGRLLATGNGVVNSTGSFVQSGGIISIRRLALSGALTSTRDGEGADNLSFTSTGVVIFNNATADQTLTVQRTSTGTFALSGVFLNLKGGGTVDDFIVNATGGLTMSGVLTISGGNLDLATNSNILIIDRGSLNIGNNAQASLTTNSNVTLTGAVTIGAAGVLTATAGTWTITNESSKPYDFSDDPLPNVTFGGAGAKVMVSNLNLSGTLTLNAGTLDLTTNSKLLSQDSGDITLANDATAILQTNSNVFSTGAITVGDAATITVTGGTWTITMKSNTTVDMDGQRFNALTKSGAGVMTVAGGGLTLSGSLIIRAGAIDLTANSQQLYQSIGNITLNDIADVRLRSNSNIYSTGSITVGDSANLTITGGTWTINNKSQQTADFNAQGLRALTKNGSGNLVIGASSQLLLSGALTINEGTLDLKTNSETMTASGGITLANDAQAHLTTDSNITLSGSFSVGAAAVLNITGGTLTVQDDANIVLDFNDQEINSLTINMPRVNAEEDNVILASALVVTGSLTITNGELRMGGKTLSVSGSITVAEDADAEIFATGSINLGGNLTQGVNGGLLMTGATLSLSGGYMDQTIEIRTTRLLSGVTLIVYNSGGGTSDDIIMSGGMVELSGALTITKGNLDLATNNIVLIAEGGVTVANDAQAALTTDQNVTVSGSLIVNDSGVWTMSGGTITFNDDGNQIIVMNGDELNIVVFNVVPTDVGNDQIIIGGAFTATGTVTVTRGDVRLGGNTLNISGSLIIANAGTATLTATGEVTFGSGLNLGAAGGLMLSGANLTLDGLDQILVQTRAVTDKQETVTLNDGYLRSLTIRASSGVSLRTSVRMFKTLTIETGSVLSLSGHTLANTGGTMINYQTLNEDLSGKLVQSGSQLVLGNSSYVSVNEFKSADTVYITITDTDENISGTARDTLTVTLAAAEGDSETVTLTEVDKTTGVFRGSIASAKATKTVGDGTIQANADTTLTVTYSDAQDALQNTDTALLTAVSSTTTTTTTSGGGGRGGGGGGGGGGGTTTSLTSVLTAAQQAKKAEAEKATFIAESLPAVRGLLSVEVEGKGVTFKDVPVGQWFAQYVFKLVKTGVASGYKDARGRLTGEYGAGNPVTYAEIAKMALEAADKDESKVTGQPKNRTARREWSEKYIKLAEDTGLSVYGMTLNVNTPATRGAVVQTILEAANIEIGEMVPDYKDVRASNTYAPAIAKATELGIVSGDTDRQGNLKGTFRPNDPVNRAETAKIMSKLLEFLGK